MKGILTKTATGWNLVYGSHVGREVWPIHAPVEKSYPVHLLEGWEGLELDFDLVLENLDGLDRYAAKITTAIDFPTKPGFVEKRTEQMLEIVANEEFAKVGDEGLFPNHTDRDIWIAGFKAGWHFKDINK